MTRHYTSFLIRCWHLDGEEKRIRVEHIQSGETSQLDTLLKVVAWIEGHWEYLPSQAPGASGLAAPKEEGASPKHDTSEPEQKGV